MKSQEEVCRANIYIYKQDRTKSSKIGVRVRADSDEVGFCETFRLYCQARFKYKPKTKKKSGNSGEVELDQV
jgi:hypothetical protein